MKDETLNQNNIYLYCCRGRSLPSLPPRPAAINSNLKNFNFASLMMADLQNYWILVAAAIVVRLLLIFFAGELSLATRPEVATPVTSLRRLAEGYWLKQSNISPYSGSMYHGSPLLLSILGPLTVRSDFEGQPAYIFCSLIFVIADFIAAMLIRAIGQKLLVTCRQNMQLLNLLKENESSDILNAGELASLVYLWNPLSIITCMGSSTSPVDNLMVVLTIYGACAGITPLAAFGWVMATHLSLYPVILIIPVVFLLGYGLDAPPQKLFWLSSHSENDAIRNNIRSQKQSSFLIFSWRPVINFILWASIWSFYVLFLSTISLKGLDGLVEMLRKTHGFILTVGDLSPNIGVLWYFFAEVFDFFRNFFLIVFQINILFMILPLAIRLKHRPCFLAFVYIAISAMLKSYPSVGDSALYLGLLGLFANELADMHFSFLLFCGYIGVILLGPVMHNLWIWRGTGNANFYFATGMAYACLQTVLIVESVSTMLNHDRKLRKSIMTRD